MKRWNGIEKLGREKEEAERKVQGVRPARRSASDNLRVEGRGGGVLKNLFRRRFRPPRAYRPRLFVAAGLSFRHRAKGSTECSKDGVVARHGVCPMLSVVAMGMLLIGRRADRRHGSRGATPTIARRPHPSVSRTDRHPLLSLAPSATLIRLNVLAHDAVCLHVRPRAADTRARESA